MQPVVIVTGAGSGIGQAISLQLAQEGWAVGCADLHPATAQETVTRISANDGKAVAISVDIANAAECSRMVSEVSDSLHHIDALVNCAGISRPGDSLNYPPTEWVKLIDVQLNGAFFAAQAVAQNWVQQKHRGSIVFITSTNAEAAFPRRAAYCAAKAGVAMLTKVLAIEWAPHNIRVNAIGPAYVETEMTRRNIAAGNISREAIEKRIPLGRMAQPNDVANAASFLLSERSGFITGHSLYVDGGWLAYGYL